MELSEVFKACAEATRLARKERSLEIAAKLRERGELFLTAPNDDLRKAGVVLITIADEIEKDEDIDTSDIPELTADFFSNAVPITTQKTSTKTKREATFWDVSGTCRVVSVFPTDSVWAVRDGEYTCEDDNENEALFTTEGLRKLRAAIDEALDEQVLQADIGVEGNRCEVGNNCGRTGCPECQQ